MIIDDELLLARATSYANSRKIHVLRKEKLGHGSDGAVWRTNRPSAVKALESEPKYKNELECYRRLKRAAVKSLAGFDVPVLEGWDDGLMVVEMSIVTPPYLLDFGKVWIDQPPPYYFDRQRVANAQADGRELFGKNWQDVEVVLYQLRKKFGIYYADPRPGNINCGDDDDDDLDWGKESPVNYSEYD